MEIPFFSIVIHEADTALTDWVLAVEAAVFLVLILREKVTDRFKKRVLITLFVSFISASFFGGLYHGFFPAKTATSGGWLVWMLTMSSIGVSSMTILQLSVLCTIRTFRNVICWGCFGLFVVYMWYVLTIDHSFHIAILAYLPALLVFLAVQIRMYLVTKFWSFLSGILAILIMLGAALLEQKHIGLHPMYFNYNALYHLLQGIALVLLFIALKSIVRQKADRYGWIV